MAGYSKRSLVEKLGIRSGHKVYLGNSPPGYLAVLGAPPDKVVLVKALKGPVDFIQFFSKEKAELESEFPRLKKGLAKDGALWVSWPKGASRIKTDLNENVAREIGLKNGLVDVKVCAVDDVWSGLKFVFRLKDR
ncbi:MAG TPA: DUF3052 domain-containing protein [Candidatus Angelobacter sp.]